MADILNLPNCGGTQSTFNSGIPACDIIRSGLYGLIGLDAGVGFTRGELASNTTFLAAVRTKSRNPRGDRAYPLFVLDNFEDTTKDRTKASTGNLTNTEVTTADAVPGFSFTHRKGEIFHKQIYAMQNAGLTWLLVDKNFAVYGTLRNDELSGFSTSDLYAGIPKFGSTSTLSSYPFELVFASISEFKENSVFIQSNSTLGTIGGLNNVDLAEFNVTANVVKVSLTGSGGTNVAQLYSTQLTQATAWIVKDSAGASVTVSPAYDATNKVMALTLSGTPYTGATSGDAFTIDLNIPSVLVATPIFMDGFESTGPIITLKP